MIDYLMKVRIPNAQSVTTNSTDNTHPSPGFGIYNSKQILINACKYHYNNQIYLLIFKSYI
jgi:hypothetical protein